MMVMGTCSIFTASGTTDDNSSADSSAILTTVGHGSIRKRIPSKNYLELVYSYGVLTLSSDVYEGEFSLKFANTETGECITIPSIYVGGSINIELPCGVYDVSAIGSDSLSFYGCLEIS